MDILQSNIQDRLLNFALDVKKDSAAPVDYSQMIWNALQNKSESEKGVRLVSSPNGLLSGFARAQTGAYTNKGERSEEALPEINFSAKA